VGKNKGLTVEGALKGWAQKRYFKRPVSARNFGWKIE